MRSFKKAKVVMLPTNQKTKYLMVYSDVEKTKGKLILNGLKNDEYKEYQHLYIISDDKISRYDWCINRDNNKVFQVQSEEEAKELNDFIGENGYNKIIATTDTSLLIDTYINQGDTVKGDLIIKRGSDCTTGLKGRINLPYPSQQFIQKYIEEYNKGNVITDVLVEYQTKLEWTYSHSGNRIQEESNPFLKINHKDNTITIKKVKDSYTREEHISNIKKFSLELGSKIHCFLKEDGTLSISIQDVNKWIEENL